MELYDFQEFAAAKHRDALRAFRQADLRGVTRETRSVPRRRWLSVFVPSRGVGDRAGLGPAGLSPKG